MSKLNKFDVDAALDCVDLRFSNYTPSVKAFEFFNYIRVFMGQDFEIDTPMWHYFLVDLLLGEVKREQFPYDKELVDSITVDPSAIAILASRGAAKSTVTTLFYPIYASILGTTPVTGPLSHILILSDSQQGGSTSQARIMASTFEKSAFAKEWFETMRFTDMEVELVRRNQPGKNLPIEKRHMLIKFRGAQALSLDSRLYTDTGYTTIGECQVGDKILGADGRLCHITKKSEVFNKPMYKITLADGRNIKVSEDHINSILYMGNNYKNGSKYSELHIPTTELLKLPMYKVNPKTGRKTHRLYIKNCEPLQYTEKHLPIDPYTLGLVLGDGYYHTTDGSIKLTGDMEDLEVYKQCIPYNIGYTDTSKGTCHTITIKGLASAYKALGLAGSKAPTKFIPTEYKFGSIEQRLALLQGLIDTDGTVAEGKRGVRFMTSSESLRDDVMDLVRSLGGTASWGISSYKQKNVVVNGTMSNRNYDLFRVYIHLNMRTARLPRKASRVRIDTDKQRVAIVSIEQITTEPSQCIAVDNAERNFITDNYVRTHNTGGIRSGSRNPVTADRFGILIADDIIKNEDEAYSEVIMEKVKTALESDAENAMRSRNTQMVVINTPFHKNDPLYKIVEGGAYTPLVMPICKEIHLDMKKEEFVGLWEENHSYESVMKRWRKAVANNNTRAFNQELMLRVSNEEDRMITDDMVQWYDRNMLMKLIEGYNIYITTDFTTTSAAKSDFSGIAVWAVNSNDDWFMLDLNLKRLELIEQYEALFRFVQIYSRGGKHIEVGVEIDGQQKAHIFALKEMMQKKNVYFSFAKQKGAPVGREGILSKAGGNSKLERFRYMLPMFQNKKMYFPEQLKDNADMKEGLKQLKGATQVGFTNKDDFCDCVSQLGAIDYVRPMYAEDALEKSDAFIDGEGDMYWTPIKEKDEYGNSTVF